MFLTLTFYFQQEVYYKIECSLNDSLHLLNAKEQLLYINNSNDTLKEMWFHLYGNAFKKGSEFDNELVSKVASGSIRFSKKKEQGYLKIKKIVFNGIEIKEYDDSKVLMILKLKEPILPKDTALFEFEYELKIPKIFSRLGHEKKHYEMSQWYIKPCVYDEKGFNYTGYHIWGEFYGEYGTFDVKINVPDDYIVLATGILREPIKYKKLLDSLSTLSKEEWEKYIKQRKRKGRITLRFYAENVHDFAWVADRNYFIRKVEYKDKEIYILIMKKNIDIYKRAPLFGKRALSSFEKWFGEYPYKTLTVADGFLDAGGGMEYPNLVIISISRGGLSFPFGFSKSLKEMFLDIVIAHEIAHQWFYGILGNNEVDEAWLDEGFASFAEERYTEKFYPPETLKTKFPKFLSLDLSLSKLEKLGLYRTINSPYNEPIVGKKAYDMISYGTIVYAKGKQILNMIRDIIGEEKFDSVMHAYYRRFRFKHPRTKDFINVLNEITGKDWEEFFKFFVYSNKNIDLYFKKVKKQNEKLIVRAGIKGEIKFPISVSGVYENDTITYVINPDEEVIFDSKNLKEIAIDIKNSFPETDEWNNFYKRKFRISPLISIPDVSTYDINYLVFPFYQSTDKFKLFLYIMGNQGAIRHFSSAAIGYSQNYRKVLYHFGISEPLLKHNSTISFGLNDFGGLRKINLNFEKIFKNTPFSLSYFKIGAGYTYNNLYSISFFEPEFYEEAEENILNFYLSYWKRTIYYNLSSKINFNLGYWGTLNYNRITYKFNFYLKRKTPLNLTFYYSGIQGKFPLHRYIYLRGSASYDNLTSFLLSYRGSISPFSDHFASGEGLSGYLNQDIKGTKIFLLRVEIPLKILNIFFEGAYIGETLNNLSDLYFDAGLSIDLIKIKIIFPLYVKDPLNEKEFKFRWLIRIKS